MSQERRRSVANKTKWKAVRARLAKNYERLICMTPQKERSSTEKTERRDLIKINIALQDIMADINPYRDEVKEK